MNYLMDILKHIAEATRPVPEDTPILIHQEGALTALQVHGCVAQAPEGWIATSLGQDVVSGAIAAPFEEPKAVSRFGVPRITPERSV